jgi:hypothetical protein
MAVPPPRRLARAASALFVDLVAGAADGNDVPRLSVDANWPKPLPTAKSLGSGTIAGISFSLRPVQ